MENIETDELEGTNL